MKAVRIHAYGGPERLRYEDAAPPPSPGSGEVLVRVEGAGINPVDAFIINGYEKTLFDFALPYIPGWDVSGRIERVGPDVMGWAVGDAVFGLLGTHGGAWAEFVIASAADVASRPASLDAVTAGAVPLVALTAWQALFERGNLVANQRVLIHAASGGVGTFAVPLAKSIGAEIYATTSARNVEFVRGLVPIM